jgi:uncharacterized protein (DUF58 family)
MPATLAPDVLARIDRLELDAKLVVEGFLAGRHRSPRQGFAVEFAQHREYAPGDDIKHIDWKVYARTERYHLKQYEQETNLVAWMIVDASESMKVATVKSPRGEAITKYDTACTLAAALGYLVTQQADCAGLVLTADRVRAFLRGSSAVGQVREMLTRMAEGPFAEVSNIGKVLRDQGGTLGRRGVIFVFSDFLDEIDDLVSGLRILKSYKHEIVLIQVLDAAEVDFPFRQPTLFRGLEALPEISTDPLTIRENYLTELKKHQDALDEATRTLGIDLLRIRTDDNLGAMLAGYLIKRQGK